ncbi:MAG: M56 family metallopeptidase [Planctomycetota bacterium]
MLHFLWVGGAIGLFALGGRRILRRASLSINYAFTLCCLLALITAPVVLFAYVVDRMKDTRPTPAGTWAAEQEQDEDLWLLMENAAPLVKNDEVATAMQNPEPAGRETLATSIMTSISSVLPWMWITGTPVLLSIVMLGLAGAYRLRRRARLLHDEPTAKLGAHLAKVLGLGKVEIGLSDRIVSPTVVGIVHPLILLPEVALRQWRSDHVRMILLHELWHVRRLDNLMNLVQRFIESVMFFHPIVWQVSRWARADREHCCDLAVLRQTKQTLAYAEMLAGLAGRQRWPWRPSLGVAIGEHNVVARIRRVLDRDRSSGKVLPATAAMMVLVAGTSSLAWAAYSRPGLLTVPVVHASQGKEGPFTRTAEVKSATTHSDAEDHRIWGYARHTGMPATERPMQQEGVTLRLVDEAVRPVVGAPVGILTRWLDGRPRVQKGRNATDTVSSRDGIVRISKKRLLELPACYLAAPCFAFHEGRQLAGTLNLTREDWGREFVIVMRSVSRVRFVLDSDELRRAERPMEWSKACVRLPGSKLSYLLRDIRLAPHAFEYLLPPGSYELVAFCGSGDNRESRPIVKCFKVPEDTPEVDLGVFQLPAAPRPRYVGGQPSKQRCSVDRVDLTHREESTAE